MWLFEEALGLFGILLVLVLIYALGYNTLAAIGSLRTKYLLRNAKHGSAAKGSGPGIH